MVSLKHPLINKILKYGVAGGTAFLLDFIVLYLILSFTHIHYTVSVPLAFIAGTIINYTINRVWVFKGTAQPLGKGYFYFLQVALIGVALTLAFMALMIEYLHVGTLISRIIAAALVFIWSFAANYILDARANKKHRHQ